MRPVPRPADVPDILTTKGAEEREEAARYFGPPRASAKAFPFTIYKHKEVKNELERLFRGKCAYCETFYASAQSMDVEQRYAIVPRRQGREGNGPRPRKDHRARQTGPLGGARVLQ